MTQAVCCLWPGMVLEVGWAFAALVRGGMLLFAAGRPRVPARAPLARRG